MNSLNETNKPTAIWLAAFLVPLSALSTNCGRLDAAPDERVTKDRPTTKTPSHSKPEAPGGPAESRSSDSLHGPDESKEPVVRMDERTRREFGVTLVTAKPGKLEVIIELTGEISFDPGRIVHVVPPVPGLAGRVFRRLGDRVEKGDLLVEVSSRKLAELVSNVLEARAQAAWARSEYLREKRLFRKGISAARDYQRAKAARDRAYASLQAARRKLGALGLTRKDISSLLQSPSGKASTYTLRAPATGSIVAKHVTTGEFVETNASLFTIADASVVWAKLRVFQRDIGTIASGQKVVIRSRHTKREARATVDYVTPMLNDETRTASARVILPNGDGRWKPGQFVTAEVTLQSYDAKVLVPITALQNMAGGTCIFVQQKDGLHCTKVAIGRRSDRFAEVTSGLPPGARYVSKGGFLLRSQATKNRFGHDH